MWLWRSVPSSLFSTMSCSCTAQTLTTSGLVSLVTASKNFLILKQILPWTNKENQILFHSKRPQDYLTCDRFFICRMYIRNVDMSDVTFYKIFHIFQGKSQKTPFSLFQTLERIIPGFRIKSKQDQLEVENLFRIYNKYIKFTFFFRSYFME